ncbi:hypothetical protein BDB00DRAFT_859422, partial [Zychaea mexicana]|uniref:uncharacterized protein n=1 Tax=Zychaea mexicana TaxID=64656 RepID=UPI0022FE0E62
DPESEHQQQEDESSSSGHSHDYSQQAQNHLTDTINGAVEEEHDDEEQTSLLGVRSTSSPNKRRLIDVLTIGLAVCTLAPLIMKLVQLLSSPPAQWDPALDQCVRDGYISWFPLPPSIQLYGNNHNISIEIVGHVSNGVIHIHRSSPNDVFDGGGVIMSRVNTYPADLISNGFDFTHDYHPDKGTHLLLSLPDREYYKYRACIYIHINVYVPFDYARTVVIATHNMEIIVNDDISSELNPMDTLELRTENAPIRFNGTSTPAWYGKDIMLSTTNRELQYDGGNLRATESVHLETSHYPIRLNDVSVSDSIQLNSLNAPIYAWNLSARYIDATATGQHNSTMITMQNATAQGIRAQTNIGEEEQKAGSITLENIIAHDTITTDTNTGHVYAQLLAGSEHVNASFGPVEIVMPAEYTGAFKAKSWTSRATVKTIDSFKDEENDENDDELIFEVSKYSEKVGFKKNKDPGTGAVSVISINAEASLAFVVNLDG